jgi:hypothetical protein
MEEGSWARQNLTQVVARRKKNRKISGMLFMFCFNNLHNAIYDSRIKQSEKRDTL